MYVNDDQREMTAPDENPPIGIVLCADKSEAVVRYTLPEDNRTIFASRYRLYLPTEEELAAEVTHAREEIELRRRLQGDQHRGQRLCGEPVSRRASRQCFGLLTDVRVVLRPSRNRNATSDLSSPLTMPDEANIYQLQIRLPSPSIDTLRGACTTSHRSPSLWAMRCAG